MAAITQAVAADAAFGTDLYRQLAATGNVVFSPASIAAALRMALAGARGETATELATALHLPGPEAAVDGLAQLAGIRAGDDLTFRAPNMMWLESAAAVRDDYLERLSGTVAVEQCDFARAPDAARQQINAAIAEQTAGKIADLISPGVIDSMTRLVLTNAVYLKALWSHQFPASEQNKNPSPRTRAGSRRPHALRTGWRTTAATTTRRCCCRIGAARWRWPWCFPTARSPNSPAGSALRRRRRHPGRLALRRRRTPG